MNYFLVLLLWLSFILVHLVDLYYIYNFTYCKVIPIPFIHRFPELWRYEDLSLLSVSSVQEHQDPQRHYCVGPEYRGTSRLLSLVPCTSPPPLLPSLNCSARLLSPVQGFAGQRVGGLSREPSLYTITSVQSDSSHNKAEAASDSKTLYSCSRQKSRFSGSWENKTRQDAYDNQYDPSSEIPLHMYSRSDAITCAADAAESLEAWEETSALQKAMVVPRTEYIIVDIPLQIGMGSPYSSSCFILIDRWHLNTWLLLVHYQYMLWGTFNFI